MTVVVSKDSQEESSRKGFHWAGIILLVCFVNLFVNYSIHHGFGVGLPGATWPMYGACGGDYFRKEVMGTVVGAFLMLKVKKPAV